MKYRIIIEKLENEEMAEEYQDFIKFYEQIIETKDENDIKAIISEINKQ